LQKGYFYQKFAIKPEFFCKKKAFAEEFVLQFSVENEVSSAKRRRAI